MKQDFTEYDIKPESFLNYLRYYGPHFNRKLSEFACSCIGKQEFSKEQLDNLLQSHNIEIPNAKLYDIVYVANWCRNVFYGSSIQDEKHFVLFIKDIFEIGSYTFIEWQDNFKKCVDFVYNLNGNEELKGEENKLAKFVAYTVRDSKFYTYSQDIEIITDNYINIHNYNHNETMQELIKRINNKDSKLELHNFYTSTKLTSMCFAILDQVVRHENLQIKTCLNCGRYFIPSYRQNEIYCDLANPDQSPTCREKGANEQYKKNLENNETQALYRRIYRQKFMIAQRNKDVKVIQKEFEKWKKDAKDKVNKMKKGKLAEDEVYKWLVENK